MPLASRASVWQVLNGALSLKTIDCSVSYPAAPVMMAFLPDKRPVAILMLNIEVGVQQRGEMNHDYSVCGERIRDVLQYSIRAYVE